MNDSPTNQTGTNTGMNDTFASNAAPQTNPFTADLKGEFTSNFGTNTNAVSQIFKEGGFVGQSKSKYMVAGGVAIVLLAVIFFFLTGEDSGDQEFVNETLGEELVTGEGLGDSLEGLGDMSDDGLAGEGLGNEGLGSEGLDSEATLGDDMLVDEPTEGLGESTLVDEGSLASTGVDAGYSAAPAAMGSGAISLVEPMDGSSLSYDETQGAAMFSWTGGGGNIIFSRNPSMSPEVMRVPVSGESYAFQHPWPGTWYWRVENASGTTETRSFNVIAPARRNVAISQPTAGGAIVGNGGVVSWQGDNGVAFYRVELSTGSWAAPEHRFATSGNSVALANVPAGQYQMRLGSFSEVAGRWEYTEAMPISVQ